MVAGTGGGMNQAVAAALNIHESIGLPWDRVISLLPVCDTDDAHGREELENERAYRGRALHFAYGETLTPERYERFCEKWDSDGTSTDGEAWDYDADDFLYVAESDIETFIKSFRQNRDKTWTKVRATLAEAAKIRAYLMRPSKSNQDRICSRRRGKGKAALALEPVILEILASYDETMSSRQIYYQVVSRGHETKSGIVSRLIVDMRADGRIPYERVVDRTREIHQDSSWEGEREILRAVSQQYRRNLWADQSTIVHIICEKQALEGIFEEVVDEFGTSLSIIRGFDSVSDLFALSRLIKRHTDHGKRVIIYYFGDHDPSGLDIERDAIEKLRNLFDCDFEWHRAGLLLSDFEDFKLVKVPVKQDTTEKKGDPRAKRYLVKFGDVAAELDALPPNELQRRIRECIQRHIESDAWKRLEATEAVEKQSLTEVVGFWDVAKKAAHRAAQKSGAA